MHRRATAAGPYPARTSVRVPTRGRPRPESLADLLGGRRGAMDATLPCAGVRGSAGCWVASRCGAACSAAVLAVGRRWRAGGWRRGDRPRSVLIGLLGGLRGGADRVAHRQGRGLLPAPECSPTRPARWPGRSASWCGGRCSVWWSARCWATDPVAAGPGAAAGVRPGQLGVGGDLRAAGGGVRAAVRWAGRCSRSWWPGSALTWPLVAAALAVSWVVLRRSLPAGHPGLRHPVTVDPDAPPGEPGAGLTVRVGGARAKKWRGRHGGSGLSGRVRYSVVGPGCDPVTARISGLFRGMAPLRAAWVGRPIRCVGQKTGPPRPDRGCQAVRPARFRRSPVAGSDPGVGGPPTHPGSPQPFGNRRP